jgi:UDP-N-acetylglucosamine 2-epimerase (non-hydrolysing)
LLDRLEKLDNVTLLGPAGYFDFVSMMKNAKVVITDSGGVQEETTYLGVPCLTLRKNTERPSTIAWGTNVLVDTSKEIVTHIKEINAGTYKTGDQPPLWDGAAAKRIARVIEKL